MILKHLSILMALSVFSSSFMAAQAGDWGYDDQPQATQPSKTPAIPGSPSLAPGLKPAPVTPNTAVPMSIQPPSRLKPGNLFGRPGGAASTRGSVTPNGPFVNVQTGAGNYGVSLNPPAYEQHMKEKPLGDDITELNSYAEPANSKPASSKPVMPEKAAAIKKTFSTDVQALTQECWQQIFEIASGNVLSEEQKGAINALVLQRLAAGAQSGGEATSVASFWPAVTAYLVAHPDQRENYSQLLKALLRWRARMQSQTLGDPKLDELAKSENSLIAEILGPPRVAVDNEDVPFTEDAVNAYTDMACFIFDQRHPGKSVDAGDNRELFAKVVCEKFHRAPTAKDRAAMAGFDLSWAKFKIVYQAADEAGRGVLLSRLAGQGAGVAWAQAKDSTLEQVLIRWPAPKSAPPVEPMLAKAQTYSAKSDSTKAADKTAAAKQVSPASASRASRRK